MSLKLGETAEKVVRWIFLVFFILILIAFISWYFIVPMSSQYEVQLNKPMERALLTDAHVEIKGAATLPSEVELIVDNVPSSTTSTDAQGAFT
jgi:hypothetical protein